MGGRMTAGRTLKLIVAFMLGASAPAMAQENPFAPILYINDRVITQYELDQRALFLQLLRSPGNPDKIAMDALIEDRLRMIEADRLGLVVTPEALQGGLEEFAGRANLSAEQFIGALGAAGVEPQAFRDFVEAGLVWRDVVRGKYLGQVTVTEAEVDREIARGAQTTKIRLLLSELVLPMQPGQEDAVLARAVELQASIASEGGFASAARRFSASASAGAGGALDWLPLENLPPALAPLLLPLEPGQVSDPVQVPNAVVLFQLRDLEETVGPPEGGVLVEYAEYLLPPDGDVAALRARADTCAQLYAEAKGQPEGTLTVRKATMADIPTDVGLELAKLDLHESSGALMRGGNRVFLMLCSRTAIPEPVIPLTEPGDGEAVAAPDAPEADLTPDRNAIRERMLNQRLAGFADRDLGQLRAEAIIRAP
jgi:peptidyl-prolyl cis-trans isomerase SurA